MASNKNVSGSEEISNNDEVLNQKKECFIITPIGDNNSEIRRHIDGIIDQSIIPAIGDKYNIIVAHREYEIGSINDRIIRDIYKADLVIANLTTTNPNVMFELAIRYSHGKPAIVIAEQGTKLPFDVIDENTIFYINDPAGANDLKLKISEFEKRIDFARKDYGPVYKVINKIPLYNEVERGSGVSNEKILQYTIDRLDSLEKSINLQMQDTSKEVSKRFTKRKIMVEFKKDEPFTNNEINHIINIFNIHDAKDISVDNKENLLIVFCIISEKALEELEDYLKVKMLNRNILYNVLYASF